MSSGGQGVKTLTSAVYICLFSFALCFLPLRELPLALLAVILFSYLRGKETGKGLYTGLGKPNIISLLSDFLICHYGKLICMNFYIFEERMTIPMLDHVQI